MEKETQIFTVSELIKEIRKTLEESFEQVSVIGEISNFKSHISGHWYFSLKDADAVINCTMWKGFNQYVFFTPQDGMKIIVNGKLTVYPPRGSYQLDIRSIKPAGLGELQEAFEKLKKKLEAEGLFDEKFKKPIPTFPKKIGVVTAIDGAAFKDLISVAERRFPLVEIVIAPSRVQGSGAAESIVKSIKLLNEYPGIDVIILPRPHPLDPFRRDHPLLEEQGWDVGMEQAPQDDGIVAVLMHAPPGKGVRSTSATRMPKYAACSAPFSHAGQGPITTRSWFILLTGIPKSGRVSQCGQLNFRVTGYIAGVILEMNIL